MTTEPAHALLPLVAQSVGGFDAIFGYFLSVLFTPAGVIVFLAGMGAVLVALLSRYSIELLACAAMFALSTMFDARDTAATVNVLIGPLEQLRAVSRPVAFALVILAAGLVLAVPIGNRHRSTGFAAWALLVMQWYYAINVMLFENFGKGALALVSITCMFVVCAIAFGRRLQDSASAAAMVRWFTVLGAAFVGANLLQLVLGPSAMVINGRLVGIAGNAQQMAGVASLLFLLNVFVAGDGSTSRLLRLAALANVAFLATFVVWSGSRTGSLTCLVGVMFMYRLQLGRFSLMAGSLAGAMLLLWSVLGADTSAADRLITGANTRGEVFQAALEAFASSPLIGVMPLGGGSGVESSFLRALALHGLVGGVLVLLPFLGILWNALAAFRLGRTSPEYRRLCDLFIGLAVALVVVNNLEGFAFGVLTLPAMIMYFTLTLGAFLAERASLGEPETFEEGAALAEQQWTERWA